MAALQATTASTSTQEVARGTHVFKVASYSVHKALGIGKFVRSACFTVGGYDWCIRCYPDGDDCQRGEGHFSIFLELMTNNAEVQTVFEFRLIDVANGILSSVFSRETHKFNSLDGAGNDTWGTPDFMKKSELEASPYLRDDLLVIKCELNVVKEPRMEETAFEIQVPPSDLSDNLGKLLESQEGADLTIKVEGEAFCAHKVVLAMRSAVFKAELFGPMSDAAKKDIAIEDMQPLVFKALLHFIYTDSLPSMDDDESEDMVKHLLVAADRYAMERMKLVCGSILCKSLHAKNVANILALADQNHCNTLKDACIKFINSLDRMDDLVASQGYEHLKTTCPAVFVDTSKHARAMHVSTIVKNKYSLHVHVDTL